MKFLVVGLGSMGRRRIRCLKALNVTESSIAGFDPRKDRRQDVEENYNLKTYGSFDEALQQHNPGALVISVPPDLHHVYMLRAVKAGIHFFVEASVTDEGMDEIIRLTKEQGIIGVPSSTMIHHPGVKIIFDIVRTGQLGKLSNIIYHVGQYLPDWHTYEKVEDFYVSNPATGGAREIVPFELTWLVELFGFPKRVCGNVRKTIDIKGAEKIDDTYNCLLDYGDFLINMVVDVVSRIAVRRLMINGEKGQLRWDWDSKKIEMYDPENQAWDCREYNVGNAAEGYNANIGEVQYIDEMRSFLEAITGRTQFPNTLENDHKVLKTLYAIEESDKTDAIITLSY